MAAKLLKALSYEQAQHFCNAPVSLTQHAAASTPSRTAFVHVYKGLALLRWCPQPDADSLRHHAHAGPCQLLQQVCPDPAGLSAACAAQRLPAASLLQAHLRYAACVSATPSHIVHAGPVGPNPSFSSGLMHTSCYRDSNLAWVRFCCLLRVFCLEHEAQMCAPYSEVIQYDSASSHRTEALPCHVAAPIAACRLAKCAAVDAQQAACNLHPLHMQFQSLHLLCMQSLPSTQPCRHRIGANWCFRLPGQSWPGSPASQTLRALH